MKKVAPESDESTEYENDHCCCDCEPDWLPSRPTRSVGRILAATIFLGAIIFLGVRAGWYMPLIMMAAIFICLLPSLIEVMCRGNTVIKHDRRPFFFWWS